MFNQNHRPFHQFVITLLLYSDCNYVVHVVCWMAQIIHYFDVSAFRAELFLNWFADMLTRTWLWFIRLTRNINEKLVVSHVHGGFLPPISVRMQWNEISDGNCWKAIERTFITKSHFHSTYFNKNTAFNAFQLETI